MGYVSIGLVYDHEFIVRYRVLAASFQHNLYNANTNVLIKFLDGPESGMSTLYVRAALWI
jgi:hypothetical protein